MRTRVLGRSGIDVSEIGLGTWGLTGEAYGPVNPGDARRTIETALDEGVTLIDVAACYGADGAMEKLLGEVLAARARTSVRVCLRVGVDRPVEGVIRKRFDAASVMELVEISLARLGTPYVDVLLLHNPRLETLRTNVLGALWDLKERSRARAVGVSAGSESVARECARASVDVVSIPYSALYPTMLHAVESELVAQRIGVLAHSPLAYGLMADTWDSSRVFAEGDHRRTRWTADELRARERQRDKYRPYVRGHVRSLREAGLRWVLTNKAVHSAIVGARTPEHARQNAHAADELPLLPQLESAGPTAR